MGKWEKFCSSSNRNCRVDRTINPIDRIKKCDRITNRSTLDT
ncbi:hypothetical protein [[Phormidium ambiguum] IAM M-71]|nr:hypothetical protein [Phormidium ambiguum]